MRKAGILILTVLLLTACVPSRETSSAFSVSSNSVLAALSIPEKYDYEYQTVDSGIQITKYNGADTEVKVPEELDGKSVVSIGDWAFSGLAITAVILPDTVTSIGWGAFSECEQLKKVTLSANLTNISKFAFSDCSALTDIEIPDGVTAIGYGAFSECSDLESVKLPAALKKIEFVCFAGCKVLQSVDIPDGVTEIEYSAFYKCNALERITIPASVTAIGEGVFEECEKLTAVCYGDYGAQYCRENGIMCVRSDG